MLKLTDIPSVLVGLRLAIAPLLLLDALDLDISQWFLVGYVIAVLSDIFDGIIARRLGVSTTRLRQADSWADICLYLCVAASAWLVYPHIIIDFKVPLLLLGGALSNINHNIKKTGSQIDIPATILAQLGIQGNEFTIVSTAT